MERQARQCTDLIDFAEIRAGDRVLDVGCGTGSLAIALTRRAEPAAIVGIDIAAPYIDYAASRSVDPRLEFRVGDEFSEQSFDCCFSLLALNFMADPWRALLEMHRVTRAGGLVAAAVWDFPGGLVYQRIFWDTVSGARCRGHRGRHYSSPLTGPEELAAAFRSAGLRNVRQCSLTIRMEYRDFGDYVKGLPPDRLDGLAAAVRRAYLAGRPDGPRSMAATAWAACGTAPNDMPAGERR